MSPVYPDWYNTLQRNDPYQRFRKESRDYQLAKAALATASAGYYLASSMGGLRGKRDSSGYVKDLHPEFQAEMDVDGYATPMGPVQETQSVSANSTMSKTGRREAFLPSSLDRKQPEVRLAKIGMSVRPKSVWSSLRDLVSGKKVLKNSFCFKLESFQDKRGLMAIPLRHDATVGDQSVDGGWQVGVQSMYTQPKAGGFEEYKTMLLPNNGKTWLTGNAPANDQQGVIIPRLSLPCLEQTSWDLNQLKLVPKNLQDVTSGESGTGTSKAQFDIVQPVQQLAGGIPIKDNGTSWYSKGIPTASHSFARKQDQGTKTAFPVADTVTSFPIFKTQLGGGSLKMRVCNQGTNKIAVEFVVLKVTNPYVGALDGIKGAGGDGTNVNPAMVVNTPNASRIWSQLWRMVGYEHSRKVTKNVSYSMGSGGNIAKNVPMLMDEPLNSPYFPWLSQSLFKARYPQYWNAEGSMATSNTSGTVNPDPSDSWTGRSAISASLTGINNDATANRSRGIKNPVAPLDEQDIPIGPTAETLAGQIGQDCPYRSVSRGHATIAGAAERTITIPIPGSIYDASRIQSYATNITPGTQVDGFLNAQMSDQSYIVLMSINGSLQDIIEPNALDDRVKVIGKAYTAAKADVYCQYTETVYPSCCDYSSVTPLAYNLGKVRGPMQEASTDAFPGKILPMAHATPTVASAVLRTGATERGGHNTGGT